MSNRLYNFLNSSSILLVLTLFVSCQNLKSQNSIEYFNFNPITKSEFERAYQNQTNAEFVESIKDSTKLKMAFNQIDSTYNSDEVFLAEQELIEPNQLTTFKLYYPKQDIMLFYIQDYHYEKACFIISNPIYAYARFFGSYGVMSKDGYWIGFKRDNCDNYLQLQICKITNEAIYPLHKFDFVSVDLNTNNSEGEIPNVFWANGNKVYLRTIKYAEMNEIELYYEIDFGK